MRQVAWVIVGLALVLATAARAAQVFVPDPVDPLAPPVPLAQAPASPAQSRPVLFVHGHNVQSATDVDFNYQKNWLQPLGDLPSFMQTLAAADNNALGIEPYFIRFEDQTRSIVDDANDVHAAVGQILARHDPSYDPADAAADTPVQVAIIAYSKGTISTRVYLKSLVETVDGMPPPNPALRPVSEFIAIAPPNHGLRTLAAALGSALSGDQLNNGYGPPVLNGSTCLATGDDAARNFIEDLNGHAMADTHADALPFAAYPSEAPGSRPAGAAPGDGVLYVSLYAHDNRDFVGGDLPPGGAGNSTESDPDCPATGLPPGPPKQGRVVAANLAPDAVNLAVASITGADALEVHQNTVHTGEVICIALHTVVHHDVPAPAACAVAPGAIAVVEPATRAAVELVLDFSLSMQHAVCAGCEPKVDILHEAAQLFIDIWSLVASPADHLGITYFRSAADEMRCADEPDCDAIAAGSAADDETLVPIFINNDRIRAQLASEVPGGNTAMGAGLANAIDRLSQFDGPRRRILLFTDGMQNRAPLVESVPAVCQPDDCTYQIAGGTSLDQGLGIAIDTIGVGTGDAYLSLLNGIANATGGTARLTLDPDTDLRQYFVEDVIDVLHGFSPQLVGYRRTVLQTGTGTETFLVNTSAEKLIFALAGRGSPEPLRVTKDGVDMTALGQKIERPGYRLWSVDLPVQVDGKPVSGEGPWQVAYAGRPGGMYELSAIVDEPALEFSVTATATSTVGSAIALTAQVAIDGVPYTDPVALTAKVHVPGAALATLLATHALAPDMARVNLEPGSSLGQQRLALLLRDDSARALLAPTVVTLPLTSSGAGIYSTATAPVTVPGTYRIDFELSGHNAKVGTFHRSQSVTTHVAFAAADPEASAVTLTSVPAIDGKPRAVIAVQPRDAFGNYLGPDYASQLRIAVRGKPAREILDDGNGTYRVELIGPYDPADSITVDVFAQPLFAGVLREIEKTPEAPARPWWQYVLALAIVAVVIVALRRSAH